MNLNVEMSTEDQLIAIQASLAKLEQRNEALVEKIEMLEEKNSDMKAMTVVMTKRLQRNLTTLYSLNDGIVENMKEMLGICEELDEDELIDLISDFDWFYKSDLFDQLEKCTPNDTNLNVSLGISDSITEINTISNSPSESAQLEETVDFISNSDSDSFSTGSFRWLIERFSPSPTKNKGQNSLKRSPRTVCAYHITHNIINHDGENVRNNLTFE